MPNPQNFSRMVDDIIATTLPYYTKSITDQIGNNNALIANLKKRKNLMQYTGGGQSIVETLDYVQNGTYLPYDGYDVLNITPQQTLTAAEFDPKQIAISTAISGREKLMNQNSASQIHNLIKSRFENMMTSFENNFEIDLHSDGTGYGGKQIMGMRALVSKTPTVGTIGGINRADFDFWRNIAVNANTQLGANPTSQTITDVMNVLYMKLTYGWELPDLILSDDNYYAMYEKSLQGLQRINNSNNANAGYTSLKYKQADFVLAGGAGSVMSANTMYMLNTKHIAYRHYTKGLVQEISNNTSINQDATIKLFGHMGNLTCKNCRKQGVLFH